MWYRKRNKIPGWLVAIDFEKAFDLVNVEFLIMAVEAFNFGQTFIKWIRTFYNGAKKLCYKQWIHFTLFWSSATRGQGDPLSPYLFILVMEVLSISIRYEKEIKLTSFADDLTTFWRIWILYINYCITLSFSVAAQALNLTLQKLRYYDWVHHKRMWTYTVFKYRIRVVRSWHIIIKTVCHWLFLGFFVRRFG